MSRAVSQPGSLGPGWRFRDPLGEVVIVRNADAPKIRGAREERIAPWDVDRWLKQTWSRATLLDLHEHLTGVSRWNASVTHSDDIDRKVMASILGGLQMRELVALRLPMPDFVSTIKKDVQPPKPEPKPPSPPIDFVVEAPCRILLAGKGVATMSAKELPGNPAGSYEWTTTSPNITLNNSKSSTVTVKAGAKPSGGRDAETITVTRTGGGGAPVTKTVKVTVATVTFSAAAGANQRFGYDDFDTPKNPVDDHISIKKSAHTFVKVTIQGGALGSDFNFVSDKPDVCKPVAPPASASFELRLDAGDKKKDKALLQAKLKCPHATWFGQIEVHVYEEKVVEVVVAKFHDSKVAGTALNFPTADYAAHTNAANEKLKEAVAKFKITNYDKSNAQTDTHYDLDGNGSLTYDIKQGGGPEVAALGAAMTGTGTKTRVAIVRKMKSYYYLGGAAKVGDTKVTVTAGSVFQYPVGMNVALGSGASIENVTVASSSGNTVTLGAPLTKAHAAGEPFEFPAAGWSSNPILIIEGTSSLDTIKWTIVHEVGHSALGLKDVDDPTSIMNWSIGWTDHRLRYCPRRLKHGSGTENQWDKIAR